MGRTRYNRAKSSSTKKNHRIEIDDGAHAQKTKRTSSLSFESAWIYTTFGCGAECARLSLVFPSFLRESGHSQTRALPRIGKVGPPILDAFRSLAFYFFCFSRGEQQQQQPRPFYFPVYASERDREYFQARSRKPPTSNTRADVDVLSLSLSFPSSLHPMSLFPGFRKNIMAARLDACAFDLLYSWRIFSLSPFFSFDNTRKLSDRVIHFWRRFSKLVAVNYISLLC